ncbi:MAG: zf-HC2 domain-containing protein [Acidobacteriota bacterium]
MSVDVETLSAYIDGELPPDDAARVEDVLERDPEVRERLDGMRAVAGGLRHLQRVAPPSTLGQDVARRIALADEKPSLLDRVEDGLSTLQGPSNVFLMFAVIFALASILIFYSVGLERKSGGLLPVIIGGPPAEPTVPDDVRNASTVLVGGRFFERAGEDLWVEAGITERGMEVATPIEAESDEGRTLLSDHPDLVGVALLGRAIVEVDGRMIELRGAPDASAYESPTGGL